MEAPVPEVTQAAVQAMLTVSGLSPSPEETALMCASFAAFRVMVDALYDVPAARYADPALRFRAADTETASWEL